MSAQGFVDTFNQEYQPSAIPQDYTAIDSMWGKFGQPFKILISINQT